MSHRFFRSRPASVILLMAGILLYVTVQVIGAGAQRHDNDFKHIYLGTLAILDGESPYPPESLLLQASRRQMRNVDLNPYVYLPFTGLSLAFLQPLPFDVASQVWFVLNHLFLLSTLWLLANALWPHNRMTALGWLLLAMAVNHPLTRTLTAGQLNLVLLLCATGAYVLLLKVRDIAAGIVLGYAALFKLAPAAFGLFFLVQRRWRGMGAMAATGLALLGLSVLFSGLRMHQDFLPMLADMRYGRSTWQHIRADGGGATFWKDPPNQSVNSLLTHLLVADNHVAEPWLPLTQKAANAATWLATLTFLGIYFWAVAGRWKRPELTPSPGAFSEFDQALFHATLLLSLLIPSLLWDHYLVALILPAAWLFQRYWGSRRIGALVGLAVAYGIVCVPWDFFSPQFRTGLWVPLMSGKLFPTVALFLMVCVEARRALKPGTAFAQIG